MNQAELRAMAKERIKDAKVLIRGKRWEFAYYAAGYSVECALKSCVLARMIHTAWIFQEKWEAKLCLTHEFGKLIDLAGLRDELNNKHAASAAAAAAAGGPPGGVFAGYWGTILQWEVSSRYLPKTEAEAKALYEAITDKSDGVLKMDSEVLVENRIEDGRKLIDELDRNNFDVTVAFWVRTSEEASWFLYIGSNSVDPAKIGDSYRTLYSCLSRISGPSLTISEVRLIHTTNPIAQNALAVRDRHAGRGPSHFHGKRLGNLSIDEAYIYPRAAGAMTPMEILQTAFAAANRPVGSGELPSRITLRDGSTVRGFLSGFQLRLPGPLTLDVLDSATNTNRKISVEDITSIQ